MIREEVIDKELEPLLPKFFANARVDVQSLRDALQNGQIREVQRFGHSLKGAGLGYGFKGMGELGKAIEDEAAQKGDPATLTKLFDQMDDYLDNVRVILREEP